MKNPLVTIVSFCVVLLTVLASAWIINEITLKRRSQAVMEQMMRQQQAASESALRSLTAPQPTGQPTPTIYP